LEQLRSNEPNTHSNVDGVGQGNLGGCASLTRVIRAHEWFGRTDSEDQKAAARFDVLQPIQISAVIPTYNRSRTVGRAIDSVLAQQYPPTEIIVVDDGSTDETRVVIDSYGAEIRWVSQANAGVSSARNLGIREARFEWVAFLDSDDYWTPGHLKHIVDSIEATDGKAVLYFSDLQLPSEEGGGLYWRRCGFDIEDQFELRFDAGEWALLPTQPMMLQASVIRRDVIQQIGGFPENLLTREDTLLFFKLGFLYPACAVSNCGTIMNSDGRLRLTRVYDGKSLTYRRATISLYKELLATLRNIDRSRQNLLIRSLASAHFSMARVLLQQKRYLAAAKSLSCSCLTSPSEFGSQFLGSSARYILKQRRSGSNG
jgi:glycosyltransferase involved in cell wall biosynthesis